MSLYSTTQQGAPALGSLLIGAVAEVVGLPAPVIVSAAAGLVIWFVMVRRIPEMSAALEVEAPASEEKTPA